MTDLDREEVGWAALMLIWDLDESHKKMGMAQIEVQCENVIVDFTQFGRIKSTSKMAKVKKEKSEGDQEKPLVLEY